MKNKKMLFVAIGAVVLSVMLMIGVLVMTLAGKSGGKMTNGMTEQVRKYVNSINTGKYDEGYALLSPETTSYITVEGFSGLMGVMMSEKDAIVEINEAKKPEMLKIKIGEVEKEFMGVSLIKSYSEMIGDKANTVKEELTVGIVEGEQGYSIYIPEETYYDYICKYVIGKANECAVESLENKNSEKIVNENAAKIDSYLTIAGNIPSTYSKYSEAVLQSELITAYKILSLGEQANAIDKVKSAYGLAETVEQKIRVCTVESEMYYAEGKYSEAIEALRNALEIDPNNPDIRRDYRRITAMMLEQIESSLISGWSNLSSAIKQKEKEMDRILKDIALVNAEEAIAKKQDAPDGYYLKGNIEYCLGDYNAAINSFESAIELSKNEDIEFKTKVSEILGMAKIAQASSKDERDIESYERIFDKDIRSLIFRENEVSGIVDTIK